MRFQVARHETDELGEIPLYIKQVIEDKADFWEYMATAELLDYYLKVPIRKARELKRGLYTQPRRILDRDQFSNWLQAKLDELSDEVACLKQLVTEVMASWGEPGEPGNPQDMVHACRLYGQCAQRFVDIAEDAMFIRPPEEFEAVGRHLADAALYPINRLPETSTFLRKIFSQPNPKGVFNFELIIDIPEGWADKFTALMEVGTRQYIANHS